jgi:hypothetical protein
MNSFRIIAEETHKYKKDSLFVLVFRDGEKYGIDVANSTSNFGRVIVDDRDKASYLFSLINEYIDEQEGYMDACIYIDSILSYDTYERIILSLHTYRRNIEKMEAYALIQMLGFNKTEKKTTFGTSMIRIYKKGEEDLFGEFISIADTGKYMFHFF